MTRQLVVGLRGGTGVDWYAAFGALWQGLQPAVPLLVPLLVLVLVLRAPLPGRGPSVSRRDPWRTFKFAARRTVLERAGPRCEAAALIFGLRCRDAAVEVDHVYPWSKGGPTVVTNGQALCRAHNRSKSSLTPPWWYLLLLERRRRRYFPPGADPRVSARMSAADSAARAAWSPRRRGF